MLVQTDPNKLGDKRLSKEEILLQSFEQTDKRLQQFRLDDHEELKNVEQRLGRPMSHQELIRKVTTTNPKVWAEESLADRNVMGFYTERNGEKVCLAAAFEKGWLPEFSIIFTDAADLPIKEKRGWRTVLIRLLSSGVLTWAQVLDIFGDAHGVNSKRWRYYTQRYRN